jgi:hypothetical protein
MRRALLLQSYRIPLQRPYQASRGLPFRPGIFDNGGPIFDTALAARMTPAGLSLPQRDIQRQGKYPCQV